MRMHPEKATAEGMGHKERKGMAFIQWKYAGKYRCSRQKGDVRRQVEPVGTGDKCIAPRMSIYKNYYCEIP